MISKSKGLLLSKTCMLSHTSIAKTSIHPSIDGDWSATCCKQTVQKHQGFDEHYDFCGLVLLIFSLLVACVHSSLKLCWTSTCSTCSNFGIVIRFDFSIVSMFATLPHWLSLHKYLYFLCPCCNNNVACPQEASLTCCCLC